MSEVLQKMKFLAEQVNSVVQGQDKAIRWLLAAMVCGGHVLLEDRPGTGKTTLAKVIAMSFGLNFQRIQFTPDLLPSDILGVSIYNPKEHSFHFYPGPIFADVLLADEINRSSPRTQSALLEAMAEKQVTIEGQKRVLEEGFFVIATQNAIESHGTYPLPEAQMDRFALSFSLLPLSVEQEMQMLKQREHGDPMQSLQAIMSKADFMVVRDEVQNVVVGEALQRYLVTLIQATRNHSDILVGASPRASLSLLKLTQALAWMEGRLYATADDLQEIWVPALCHRILCDVDDARAKVKKETLLKEILTSVPVPT